MMKVTKARVWLTRYIKISDCIYRLYLMESNYIIEVQHAEHQHWLVLLDKETQGEGPEKPIPHPLLDLRKPIMFENYNGLTFMCSPGG
jgi:hypothetical protein